MWARKAFAQPLEGLEKDPSGPQIDLRKELIANLGQRVTMIASYNLPITTSSERLLWAVETEDTITVAKALEKCVKNDPTIKKRLIDGHVVWEIVEEEDTGVPQLKVDVPTLTPKKDDGKTKPDEKDDDEVRKVTSCPRGDHRCPRAVVRRLAHRLPGQDPEAVDESHRLATQPEFQQVWDLTFGNLGMKQQSSRSFSWTDRAVQPTYELIRQGKMPQSESLLGRTLNSLAAPGKKGAPRQHGSTAANCPT